MALHDDPARLDIGNYPLRYTSRALFADMDGFRHINNVAIARFFEEGRAAGIIEAFGLDSLLNPPEEPRWIVTREGQDEEVQCWHCGTALHHWPRENIERFSPSLQLTLRLESTLLRSLSGQASCKNDDWSTI